MFSISNLLSVLLIITMEMSLSACGAEAPSQPGPEDTTPSAQEQEAPEEPADAASNLTVTAGTEHYRGFLLDNVLHAPEGDIHYHIYVPDDYDGSAPYALYLTLPGYEGLYFQGVGQNLYNEDFAFEALHYNDQMIVAAPQLNDWGETSAEQTIVLTEYLLDAYHIDPNRVYANGYSGGGETMSLVMGMRPDLFTAYLQCSSQWDGAYEPVVGPGCRCISSSARAMSTTALSLPGRPTTNSTPYTRRLDSQTMRSISCWCWTSRMRTISGKAAPPTSTAAAICLPRTLPSWAGCSLKGQVTPKTIRRRMKGGGPRCQIDGWWI